jgi:hypothetical protein
VWYPVYVMFHHPGARFFIISSSNHFLHRRIMNMVEVQSITYSLSQSFTQQHYSSTQGDYVIYLWLMI